MREILFRGKRLDGGEWVQGHNIILTEQGRGRAFIVPTGEYVDDCRTKTGELILRMPQIEIVSETVGQYTGLTDKNGKKIFEGDILESRYDEKHPEEACYEVVLWYDNGWCIQQDGYATPDHLSEDEILKYSEVVGNIADNPRIVRQ